MNDLGAKLDASSDIQALHEISELVNGKEEAWEADLAVQRAELETLQAALQRARMAAQRPAGTPSAEEHEGAVRRLTEEQYAAHKSLNEEEAQTSRCDGELARLRAEREDVRALKVEDRGENHAQVLRLGLFGGMGFNVLDERPAKILVRECCWGCARPSEEVGAGEGGEGSQLAVVRAWQR